MNRLGSLVAPVAILLVLLAVLAALRRGVFTLDELNTDAAAAMTLLLVATLCPRRSWRCCAALLQAAGDGSQAEMLQNPHSPCWLRSTQLAHATEH